MAEDQQRQTVGINWTSLAMRRWRKRLFQPCWKKNIETGLPFSFVRYRMERLHVHGWDRTGWANVDHG